MNPTKTISALAALAGIALVVAGCGGKVLGAGLVAGDVCPTVGQLRCGTSADGATKNVAIHCVGSGKQGTWQQVFACPGLEICGEEVGYSSITCGTIGYPVDVAFAVTDGACDAEGTSACSFDRTRVLTCLAGSWDQSDACGGGRAPCTSLPPGSSTSSVICDPSSTNGCIACGS